MWVFLFILPLIQGFDYFLLAESWPPSIGNSKITHFALHGLWPQYNESSWPQWCNNQSKFNINKLQPLLPQMKKEWPSVLPHHSNIAFWKHEWLKHGTCALDVLPSEYEYFSSALALWKIYKPFHALDALNITTGSSYSALKLSWYLWDEYQQWVSIWCDEQQNLVRVEFCFNLDLTLRSCPVELSCSGNFTLPK